MIITWLEYVEKAKASFQPKISIHLQQTRLN